MYFSFSFVVKKKSSFTLLSNWYVYLHIKSIYPRKVPKERENTQSSSTPFGRCLNGCCRRTGILSLAKNARGASDVLLHNVIVGVKPQPTLFNGKLKMESGKLFYTLPFIYPPLEINSLFFHNKRFFLGETAKHY